MKYVPSIENPGAPLSSSIVFLTLPAQHFHGLGQPTLLYFPLCMSLADLPGSAVCALDAHKL